MKKLSLFAMVYCICFYAFSQENHQGPIKKKPEFFAGFSYSYLVANLQLAHMSKHSVWYGNDYGTYELTKDEIDEVNSQVDRNNTVNNANIELGMVLFKTPDLKWKVSGNVIAGLARSNASIYNNMTDKEEYNFDSKFIKPCVGIGFDVSYQLDPRWGISLRPFVLCTFGKTEEISDSINVAPEGFTMTTSDKYRSFYQRTSILATYTTGNFVFAAGPGLYWLISNHDYHIERVYVSNGDLLIDDINSRSINKMFIDATLYARWNFAGPFGLYVLSGLGADIIVSGGILVTF